MPWLDIAIVAVLIVSVGVGALRGLAREALSLLSWILAGWIAYRFSMDASGFFSGWIANPWYQVVAAALVLFVGTMILMGLVSVLLSKLLGKIGLRGVDRSLGGLFGAARGILILAGAWLLLSSLGFNKTPWWQSSVLAEWFEVPAAILADLIDRTVKQLGSA